MSLGDFLRFGIMSGVGFSGDWRDSRLGQAFFWSFGVLIPGGLAIATDSTLDALVRVLGGSVAVGTGIGLGIAMRRKLAARGRHRREPDPEASLPSHGRAPEAPPNDPEQPTTTPGQ